MNSSDINPRVQRILLAVAALVIGGLLTVAVNWLRGVSWDWFDVVFGALLLGTWPVIMVFRTPAELNQAVEDRYALNPDFTPKNG